MKKEQLWIVTRVDGKIASVAADFRHFAAIAAKVASMPPGSVAEITASKIGTAELAALSETTLWEDLRLFGSAFQQKVWRELFLLTHDEEGKARPIEEVKLLSYSQLAERCGNLPGVRAVAHAVAVNPVAYIIPCHLVIPKESIDKAESIRASAQDTIFKGRDLYLLNSIDVGDYAYGSALKRSLIALQLDSK